MLATMQQWQAKQALTVTVETVKPHPWHGPCVRVVRRKEGRPSGNPHKVAHAGPFRALGQRGPCGFECYLCGWLCDRFEDSVGAPPRPPPRPHPQPDDVYDPGAVLIDGRNIE